jgi:hypothetical protein
MKKLIIALLLVSILLVCGISGCPKTEKSSIQTSETSEITEKTSVSNDLDVLSNEASGINTSWEDDSKIVPIDSSEFID